MYRTVRSQKVSVSTTRRRTRAHVPHVPRSPHMIDGILMHETDTQQTRETSLSTLRLAPRSTRYTVRKTPCWLSAAEVPSPYVSTPWVVYVSHFFEGSYTSKREYGNFSLLRSYTLRNMTLPGLGLGIGLGIGFG